ncbi:hypothetical protein K457DRAFT_1886713 [Linnemannia elongata AG-77]|uniref:Zn(2)-C6 fungal-type domain-containing protein n=1 Tax=Linnemannia elongata AG-77 TaxID=1314771 RepID=A0A197K6U4_9FUNG|nr:hypothetical protein K457DRAFT_1886713 [Linnemannia elongata AG-77]
MYATTNLFLHPNQLYFSSNQNQQQPPPPPTPTTTTTHHKRTYVTRACDHCRQRRAVCDNQKPKCSRCTKKKIDCTFLVPQRKRGPIAKTKGDSSLEPNQEQGLSVDLNYNNYNNYTQSCNNNTNNSNSNSHSNISSNNSNIDSDSSNTNNSSPSIIPLDIITNLSFDPSINNDNSGNNNTPSTVKDNVGLVLEIGHELEKDSEEKEDVESSLFRQFIRSPSGTPWPATNDPLESYYPSLASPVDLSYRQPHINDDIFSKPVVDHLVALFFEHCFQEFDLFSPLAFLRLYVQGAANPSLVDMFCGVGSRFSDHPAVAKNPPYTSGEPYVDRVKANMPELVLDASMDTIHILILLTFYEYSVGRHGLAYRIECLSAVIASDLRLFQYYQKPPTSASSSTPSSSVSSPSDFLHDSEADRVAIEIKIRTSTFLLISDLMSSAVSGLTPKFDHSTLRAANSSSDSSWWMERPQEPGGIPFEPVDDFSASILHKGMLRRPVSDLNGHLVMFMDLVNAVCAFVRTEYTLEKWKRHMHTETKGGSESRVSSGSGSNVLPELNADSVSMSVSMSLSSSSPAAGAAVGNQSETLRQIGSISVSKHHPHLQRQYLLNREPSSTATTFAPLSKTVTPVDNYSAILTTTADVFMPSTNPHPVRPPPSASPPRHVPDADTSPQRKSDLSEYTKLDSEVERWKAHLPLEFVPNHVKLSVFKADNKTLNAMEGVIFTDSMSGGAKMESLTTTSAAMVERTPLDKCTELANKISLMIDAFTTEQIKYKGHTFSLQVFLAATM